jgi:DNA-binding XRE family transcriptional regulator
MTPTITNTLVKSKSFFFSPYHSDMGRKPKARRDAYGAWLYHLRNERNLTQQELADLTKISQKNIAYWERSGKLKGRQEILRLSKALKVSVKELLRAER